MPGLLHSPRFYEKVEHGYHGLSVYYVRPNLVFVFAGFPGSPLSASGAPQPVRPAFLTRQTLPRSALSYLTRCRMVHIEIHGTERAFGGGLGFSVGSPVGLGYCRISCSRRGGAFQVGEPRVGELRRVTIERHPDGPARAGRGTRRTLRNFHLPETFR